MGLLAPLLGCSAACQKRGLLLGGIFRDALRWWGRFPAEAESAALGAALQAAAVLEGMPVREYVSTNPPPCEPEASKALQ